MKNICFKILYVITAVVVIVELALTVKGSLFTDIADLPVGELSYSAVSPSGEKYMNVYQVKNNLGTAVRGEIVTPDNSHNIFWQTDIETVDVYWVDEQNIVINGIMLNCDDTFGYDCRRGYSLFDDGALEQNFMEYKG